MKKMLALILAVVLCLMMTVPAFAVYETVEKPWFVTKDWFEKLSWFEKQAWFEENPWFTELIWDYRSW